MGWRLRMAAKIVFSRLPINYRVWHRLGVFRHGRMEDPSYALRVFQKHYRCYLDAGGRCDDYSVLELGPGDSLYTAVIARAHGAKEVFLVDTVDAAQMEPSSYRKLIDQLKDYCLHESLHPKMGSRDALLASCHASYMTNGLASLRKLGAASIDFVFSNAVLEHVRREDFEPHLKELRRILKPLGIMSHRIDLKDHLGGALNNLRFSRRLWECPLFARSGFYTNRFRASELLDRFRRAGFECTIVQEDRWPLAPIRRDRLSREFATLSDADLCISGFNVVCLCREDGHDSE